MENKEKLESVCVNLRCVTQSVKGGVPLERLQRDYRDLLGEQIPFRDLGYTNLEALIRDIPHTVKLIRNGSQVMVDAVADEATAHISSLVSRQKQVKPKMRFTRRPVLHRRGGGMATGRTGYLGKNFNPNYKPSFKKYSQPDSYVYKHKTTYPPSNEYSRPRTPPTEYSRPRTPPMEYSRPRTPPVSSRSRTPPLAQEPSTHRTKNPFSRRGTEIAPRFLRLQQRKLESRRTPTPPSEPESPPRRSPHIPYTPPGSPPSPIPPPKAAPPRPRPVAVEPDEYSLVGAPQGNPRPLISRTNNQRVEMLRQLECAASAMEYVEIYANMNNMDLRYVTTKMGQKQKTYISKLYLGDQKTYQSYPATASTELEAKELVATEAAKDIEESREDLALFPETTITTPEEIMTLLIRIEEIVCEKPTGMFTNGIIKEYESKFNESLPPSWIDLLKQSTSVDIEEVGITYGRVPEGVKYIVRPSKVPSSGNTTPSSSSSKTDQLYEQLPKKFSKTSLVTSPARKVPELVIPSGNEWEVYVTSVSDTIAVRLIEYDTDYLELSNQMSEYYSSHRIPVQNIFECHIYATEVSSDPLIITRVLAHKILDDDYVECYFPDEGSFATLKITDLQELDSTFLELPYQAVHMALDEFEDFEPLCKTEDWKCLLNQSLIAQIKRWNAPYRGFFPDFQGMHGHIYCVVLFNTSGVEDINMNEVMKQNILDGLSCRLPKLSMSCQGYLTHVLDDGEIFIRLMHPENSWLESSLERMTPAFEEGCLQTDFLNIKDTVFVAKFDNGKWYRAIAEDPSLDPSLVSEIPVFFIDYGNSSTVPLTHICELHPHSELLSVLGNQAIRCDMFNALPTPTSKWSYKAIHKLVDMAPFNEELLIRVMDEGSDVTLPKLNLYKRIFTKEDSFIVSINDNLATASNLFLDVTADGNTVAFQAPTKLQLDRSTRTIRSQAAFSSFTPSDNIPVEENGHSNSLLSPSTIQWPLTPDNLKSPDAQDDQFPAPLKLPVIPEKGEFFDVFVTMAANPHNFVVQDLKSSTEMDDLMFKMKQCYSSDENIIEMHLSLLKENEYYAALHSDNEWYRARLVTIINTDPVMAAVHYVDFGDYNTVNMQNLQRLWKEFRKLPCQAIKASLAGVKPTARDWSPDQCIAFKDIVTEKTFTSIIQKKELKTNKDISSYELELTLIDTTSDTDIYIDELLVKDSIAISL